MKRTDCSHRKALFICGGTSSEPGEHSRYRTSICRDCGRFRVSTCRNGQHMLVDFWLESDEAVEAAGEYVRSLEASHDNA